MVESGTILSLKGICKTFAAPVLQDVSLHLNQGESLALVGANGAGKSTLIKIILGLVKADKGEGFLFGHSLGDAKGREALGYLPEMPGFWGELSTLELLDFASALRGLSPEKTEQQKQRLLNVLGLKVRGGRPMGGYSKGMLQRAGIAQALIHEPKMVILDEPMSGLDPRAQEKLRSILLNLKRQGTALLISSHALDDIRLLCDRVAVLEKSKLVLEGPTAQVLDELLARYRSSEPWDEDPLGEWSEPGEKSVP